MKNRPRGGLGRGLGALIPTAPPPAAAEKGEPAWEQGPSDAGGAAQADLPGKTTGRPGRKTRWSA